ncbi:heparan-alpha-glucosaminide N-acetyltransferase domain-containing protein [Phytoactinopolyspora limicola]|uniref:heparan-alpha-glucosaminide N-acetyltransferase domain-containing protein n=1 Tax=Phytoactinopolyspora limicola TaxID=2715536 RepID=UPI00140B401F|nr:heparan-alpha-glucosaminide N-acetyltransferase domain-containing protein [Phytoactinopolyspora limicola]
MPAHAKRAGRRLQGVDAARGVALIGMIAVHITPSIGDDGQSTLAHLLASGRASALFALLAGVGLALASGGTIPPRGARLRQAFAGTATRAALLITVGMILGQLDSGVAVILVYYGLFFILALPFLGLRARTLLPLAATWAVLAPLISHLLRIDAPRSAPGDPTVESLAEPADLLRQLILTGYYPALPWMAYLLAGIGLGRLALASATVAWRLLVGGAALATICSLLSWLLLRQGVLERLIDAGTGAHPTSRPFTDGPLTTSFYGTTPTTSWWWLTVASPHSSTPFDLLHTIGTAAAVLGLMLLLGHRLPTALTPLADVGSMTFTLYTLHVVLLATILPRDHEHALLWHVVIVVGVAVPWRRFIGRGPLEAAAAAGAKAAQASLKA